MKKKLKKDGKSFWCPILQLRIQTGKQHFKENSDMHEKYEYAGKLVFLGVTN